MRRLRHWRALNRPECAGKLRMGRRVQQPPTAWADRQHPTRRSRGGVSHENLNTPDMVA